VKIIIVKCSVSSMDRGGHPYFLDYSGKYKIFSANSKDHAPCRGGTDYKKTIQIGEAGYTTEYHRARSIEVGFE